MRIAYIMRYWPVYGGGETITATLANELVKRGHQVHILYNYRNDVAPMPYKISDEIFETQINTVDNNKSNVNILSSYIQANNIDVMINQWGNHRLCYEAKKKTGTKLIICWHLDVIQKVRPHGIRQNLFKILIGNNGFSKWSENKQIQMHIDNNKYSDKYVFLSKSFEDDYKCKAGNNAIESKLTSISNPLTYSSNYDISKFNLKKKEVLFVGRILEYHKRLSYILKIWNLIETDHSLDDWSLVIVGDGPDMVPTQDLSEKLKLKRVSFEGFKDPRPYYERSSLFMMTSAFEGFGMTLVEAQQYGVVPIVMNTYLSLHDIISDGINGVIINDGDIEGFASSMKLLMTNVDKRKQLAKSGLITCQQFRANSIVDQWETLFKNVVTE